MDQNKEDVITACGAYLVLQEEKKIYIFFLICEVGL
jgi:hypothetical protein